MLSESKRSDTDILWGAAAIGEELGLSERQAYHRLERGQIPARKIGASWAASKSALRKLFELGE